LLFVNNIDSNGVRLSSIRATNLFFRAVDPL